MIVMTVGSQVHHIIMITISQVNLVLGVVNDILDHNAIQEDKFEAKIESFSPKEAFKFIE